MPSPEDRAALVALLAEARRPWQDYSALVEEAGGALTVLEEEHGLLAPERLADATAQLIGWEARGLTLVTVLDPGYPENLRAVHDRPPLLFIAGALEPRDARSVAVVGTRQPTARGLRLAKAIAGRLAEHGFTVVSGLAAGIDTAVHTAVLEVGSRTLAVIGTGLDHAYPPQNRTLQRTIACRHAVLSQFWPQAPPSKRSFPMRNAVMSGLTLATVVVEASRTSGTRVQAKRALAQGRPVLLHAALLSQDWARELAARPATHVIETPVQAAETVARLTDAGALTP